MELNNSKKQELVLKIKYSNTLKNAPTSSALLQYLHEATLKNKELKEGVIDIEFFGNKEITEKNNPRFRVNVYNLRKKLNAYYETEGKTDSWQVVIEKGQYKISFIKTVKEGHLIKNINWKVAIPYIGLFSALLTLLLVTKTPKAPKIWKNFLDSKTQTNLYIGDHFGIAGNTITGKRGWTRDFSINNTKEFYELVDTHPELKGKISPSSYSYSTRMSALATQKIQEIFQYHKKSFDIRFSTQTTIPEIKESHAIYVGPSKNKNQFLTFFNEANPYCKIIDNTIKISGLTASENNSYSFNSQNTQEEYALVSKYTSIGNKEHFVFFSQHDIGVSATVAYFTNLDSVSKFEKTHLKNHNHFTALYKVKGLNRTDTDLKLVQVITF